MSAQGTLKVECVRIGKVGARTGKVRVLKRSECLLRELQKLTEQGR